MDISSILISQLNNLFGIALPDYIRVENRAVANSIHLLLTTIFGAIISWLIKLLFDGGITLCLRRTGLIRRHPTQFNPNGVQAPAKFIYEVYFSSASETVAFVKWMEKYNADKPKNASFYIGSSLADVIDKQELVAKEKTLTPRTDGYHPLMWSVSEALEKDAPVWHGSDGHYVFAGKWNTESSETYKSGLDSVVQSPYGFILRSNSRLALRETVNDIISNDPKLDTAFNVDSNQLSIVKVNIDDSGPHRGAQTKTVKNGVVNTKKTFDYMFFTEKKKVLDVLDKFKAKKLFPAGVPIDNKVGILLYGPPGTGKTGVIQCIANYLKRHIVLVDLTKVRTNKALDDVLALNPREHLFVFEEIDTVLGVIGDRSKSDGADKTDSSVGTEPKRDDVLTMLMAANNPAASKELAKKMNEKKDALNLGYLLQKLDGVESGEDRVIIATTNYPDKIDSALIRPGRFGFQLNLGYCTEQMLRDIMGMMFGLNEGAKKRLVIPPEHIDKLAPTWVIQHSMTHSTAEEAIAHF
jgi:hypothetical protein